MSWKKIILLVLASWCGFLLICVIAANVAKHFEPEKKCIGNYQPCGRSIMPCCRTRQLENPCDMPEDFICNHLSGGYCEPLSEIVNLHEYIRLTTNLNITNINERTSQYQALVELSTLETTMYYVVYFCFASLFFLTFLVLIYYARLAKNYVPVQTDDIPASN